MYTALKIPAPPNHIFLPAFSDQNWSAMEKKKLYKTDIEVDEKNKTTQNKEQNTQKRKNCCLYLDSRQFGGDSLIIDLFHIILSSKLLD